MTLSSQLPAWCLLICVPLAHAGGRECQLRDWAQAAVSADAAVSAPAIASLRAAGPEGLPALIDVHAALLAGGREALGRSDEAAIDPAWRRLTAALDAVARARDTYAARLYWYTDWDQAKAAAATSGKAILSLRLLGNLDDEYSCANSRFFRTALYANAEVSSYLRDHFILHWKSVRPVPRVSIDFGDGRTLQRTLTGNSTHYVLDTDGRVIDALPGLYGPARFLREVQTAGQMALSAQRADPSQRELMLCDYHEQRETWLRAAWNSDLLSAGAAVPGPITANASGKAPDAVKAAMVTMGKRAVEFSVLRDLLPGARELENATGGAVWERIAKSRGDDSRLDEASLRFMREKSALMRQAAASYQAHRAPAGCVPEMAERFMELMALDTVRNEYLYHRTIHEWLAAGGPAPDVDTLNARVYAELFLTPDSDPWLGLLPADVYTALADDGVR